jgi:hypothetical protein
VAQFAIAACEAGLKNLLRGYELNTNQIGAERGLEKAAQPRVLIQSSLIGCIRDVEAWAEPRGTTHMLFASLWNWGFEVARRRKRRNDIEGA